jgi:PRTRC genetic system ThiF family protein
MKSQLNRDSLYARKILLPVRKKVHLALIGMGGTGSWLAPHIVRTAKLIQEVQGREVSVTFCDPDAVEEKNIYRQNFCSAEIGTNKAVTLAQRFGHAWGFPIVAVDQSYTHKLNALRDAIFSYEAQRDATVVLITCVDNNAARREVVKMLGREMPHCWWMDTGNVKVSGQVSVGRPLLKEPSPLRLPGFTTWTPAPSTQFPGIMAEEEVEHDQTADYESMSCAEIALVDEQGLSINHAIASTAASMLMKLLVVGDLQYHCAYVSTESGTSFAYNSPRILRKHLKTAKESVSLLDLEDDE